MRRYPQPARSDIGADERAGYDFVADRAANQQSSAAADGLLDNLPIDAGPYWGSLLTSPRFAEGIARMGILVREAGEREDSYSHADREFVDQVLSRDLGTDVVQGLHIPDALAAGVRLDAIRALRTGDESVLTEAEALRARFVRAVVTGVVGDDLLAAMRAEMGHRAVLEYTVFVLWLQFTIRLMQAVGVPEPGPGEIDALIERLAVGELAVPTFTTRAG